MFAKTNHKYTRTDGTVLEYTQTTCNCVLKSIKDEVRENGNGTAYVWAEVEFTNRHGEIKTVDAQIYKTNLEKMEVEKSYMLTIRKTKGDDRLLMTVAPFSGGNKASLDDFGFEDEVEAPAAVKTEVPATADTPF